ncbi:MAG: flagellin lysine-N-methylase [Candidatus Spyradocola sp.]
MEPDFFADFRCIAARCADSCCIGWEIDVDAETLQKYEELPGELGDELRRCIVREDGIAHFALGAGERCPFLDETGLCRIITALGDGALCDICREHPRFYEWFGSRVEAGLGLCCEEACRLLLASDRPLTFVETECGAPDEPFDGDTELLRALEPVRERAIALLQDRSLPFFDRLRRFMAYLTGVQDELDGFPPAEEPAEIELPGDDALLELCRRMEPMNDDWPRLVARMETPGTPADVPDWVYERAAVYLTYRWLLKAAFDGDVLGKAMLVTAFLCLLRRMLDSGAAASAAEGLRLLSRQIEYSEVNTEIVERMDL